MRHLELHILQSVPVACLNRDDLGSPKTAFFGGVKRARVSSQCWKRAIRIYAKEIAPELFTGERTKLLPEPLAAFIGEVAKEKNIQLKKSPEEGARAIADLLGKLDNDLQVKTLFFTSPAELRAMAEKYVENGEDAKKAAKAKVSWADAADIALFGRMVAQDHTMTLEGAAMFSHAISTHRAEPEMDFYSAVDDRKPDEAEDAGAGMMGTLEFQSAVYYRFAAINLDMLEDKEHLGTVSVELRRQIVSAFVEAVIKAMPSARKNSMNGNTLPGYVLCIVREKGHPVQLVNAFEKPVKGGMKGLMSESVDALRKEAGAMQSKWGMVPEASFELAEDSETTFTDFIEGLVAYVR